MKSGANSWNNTSILNKIVMQSKSMKTFQPYTYDDVSCHLSISRQITHTGEDKEDSDHANRKLYWSDKQNPIRLR